MLAVKPHSHSSGFASLFSASGNCKCSHLRNLEITLGKEERICYFNATFQTVTQAGQLSMAFLGRNNSPPKVLQTHMDALPVISTVTNARERRAQFWCSEYF